MKKVFKAKSFWIISILASGVIFVAFLNLDRIWKAQMEIMFIAKNETTSQNLDTILTNMKNIVKSQAFFERVASYDNDFKGVSVDLPDQKQAAYWNSKISVKIIPKSSILEIEVSDKNNFLAYDLSRTVSRELARNSSLFYNAKSELDIRFIEGPLTFSDTKHGEGYILIGSLLTGLIFTFFSFLISESAAKNFPQNNGKDGNLPFSGSFQNYQKNKLNLFPIKKDELPNDKPEKTEIKSVKERKAVAPQNLPIAESFPWETDDSNSPYLVKKEAISAPSKEKPIIREATPEEVKERLNKLLSGKL